MLKKAWLAAAVCAIAVSGWERAIGADEAAEGNRVPWCQTQEIWESRGLGGYAPADGRCPIQGDCDLPAVRDHYLVEPETLFKTIRVHVHVFREDDGSNPAATEAEVIAQMQEFSEDYAPHRIRFVYTWSWADNSLYRHGSQIQAMKNEYAISPETICNIYVVELDYAFGTFPWDPNALTSQGGIVMAESFFPEVHHVLSHEMGHNLGLWHTHHGVVEVQECGVCYEIPYPASDTTGDFCADTPPAPVQTICENYVGTDPCSGLGWGHPFGYTMPENYMSYAGLDPDGCWEIFTPQQGARIHCWIEAELSTWLACSSQEDCNGNFIPDDCDIMEGTSADENENGIPDECEGTCVWDCEDEPDGEVGIDDLVAVINHWGPCADPGDCPWDCEDEPDGSVGIDDLVAVINHWGACP